MPKVVVVGGSVAGLGVAIGLANRGIEATVLERDPPPTSSNGEDAFLEWRRPGVAQFRQAHGFSARSRNLLLEHAPEVVDTLVGDGVEVVNFFRLLAPADMWTDADEAFGSLWTRRPGFELALRRYAEKVTEIRAPVAVDGLVFSAERGTQRVSGVRLEDGSVVEADVVVDAAGRRSPVPGWLREAGVEVGLEEQDCDIVYFTRYFRRNPSGMPTLALVGSPPGICDRFGFNTFTGDHDTYGLLFVSRPDDRRLFALRQAEVFEAVARAVPRLAPWTEPENGTPLHDPEMMTGNRNRRWRYLRDDRPAVLGVLPVGDSLCSTNPFYGWGASMALTYAFAAARSIDEHRGDLQDVLHSYEADIGAEADAVFNESAADDRARIYRWRNQPVPEWDRAEMERRDLISCIGAGALRDEVLGRALLRRTNLIDSPAAALDDPVVVARAQNTQRILAGKAARKIGPDGGELDEIIAAHTTAQ